ncbi:MAG: aldose 1-epimerase family protein [Vagococcus sp.]
MSVILENEKSKVTIKKFGAELCGFFSKETTIEYIWQGDKEYWGKHAPVLFPFVGQLKDNTYRYKGQNYQMTKHGFARDSLFEVKNQTADSVEFLLTSNSETRTIYPFDFEFLVIYTLKDNTLTTEYRVECLSDDMYFGVGGHPAFNVPLVSGTTFEDYYLQARPTKSRLLIPLDGPLIDLENKTLAQTNTSIQLYHDMFEHDAVILQTNDVNSFKIASDKTNHSVKLSYDNFPFVGFWSPYPKKSPFVCIEPWSGIADAVDSTGDIETKFGMNYLKKNDVFSQSFDITID